VNVGIAQRLTQHRLSEIEEEDIMSISKVVKKYKINEQPSDFSLKKNKRATGRPQDLADAENLE
jgi:hypothetical protein